MFAMCHHLVLTPSQENRRRRRAQKREENKVKWMHVSSDDSDVMLEMAKIRAQKKRRESDGVKTEPQEEP